MSNTPAHKIGRYNLQVVIWRNSGEKGPWYSVQIDRSFKVDEGWRHTDALGQDDILPAIKLLDMADTWIMNQVAADRKARKESDQAVK